MKAPASSVRLWREPVTLPTYRPMPPDRNPMFLEKRVYQGSSGKVYPLPFIDRIAEEKTDRQWDAVYLENEFIRVMVLPEIGGRIHAARDKTNGYDFIYRQDTIKPALVGLAGPWISGGIEFNWPQHHRPSTFLPTDVQIEEDADGSRTVWLGEHEPMNRMKGMHGVCLRPGSACIEVKVRLYNRTPFTQTFLWWANAAVRVHERYQSFFPPDVRYVADHAKRAVIEFPLCQGRYYGVDYGARAGNGVPPDQMPLKFAPPGDYPPNDLSWYANIPVPTSYMALGSEEDFFGGYDHAVQAGIVHVADHAIAPGKKQWTWGNHEFGYAWDRNLSEDAGPYIELMAGIFTDNQPDFSFLAPGETRTFTQVWYPIQRIGPAQKANRDAAVSLQFEEGQARIGVSPAFVLPEATVRLLVRGEEVAEFTGDLAPGNPLLETVTLREGTAETDLRLEVIAEDGREVVSYAPRAAAPGREPPAATEPPPPKGIGSVEELYLTGLHLEQYRHAISAPEIYWSEALHRDPGDSRCNNAMGRLHLRRGEFSLAKVYFTRAIERLTLRNPNPRDGEPHYHRGLALRWLGRDDDAYAAFSKAAWNYAWQAPAFTALAQIDCRRGEWEMAREHLERALTTNAEDLRARDLLAVVLRRLEREADADALLTDTLALDPLDWWARYLRGEALLCDTQTRLDIALDFACAGLYGEAIRLLKAAIPEPGSGTEPLVGYYLGWLYEKRGDEEAAFNHYAAAAQAPPDYCFPARLEEIPILEAAMTANPADARAPYYLGCLLYDRRRHEEAIGLWERSARRDPSFATVWRNLGVGYFNVRRNPAAACDAYERAVTADPDDARLLYERDQLWKRLGEPATRRLSALEARPELVRRRDDLSIELGALYNQTGRHEAALALLESRRFQPWEGGEGQALGQYVRTRLALGRKALATGDPAAARSHFEAALAPPPNLGEARHPLANAADIHYWLGVACDALGEPEMAAAHWRRAAAFRGDFQEMSVRDFSEMTYYSALALRRLNCEDEARHLLEDLRTYAQELSSADARIDYFATSLPTMLIFEDDLARRQFLTAKFLRAQAELGLGNEEEAKRLLTRLLARDPSHAMGADLLEEMG